VCAASPAEQMQTNEPTKQEQLVDGPTLLEIIFKPECRPTLRWLRDQQKRRAIPFLKIGRLVFFDPVTVRQHFAEKQAVKARK